MIVRVFALSAVLASSVLVSAASAQVITDSSGKFSVGIGADGELVNNATGTGFKRLSDGFDGIAGSGGVGRDTWGANSAFADQNNVGSQGLSNSVVTTGAHSAVATADTASGLHVVQNYSFSAENILSISTTVTNVSGLDQDLVFSRDVDWNIDPTAFGENVFGPIGSSPFVIDSSFYGFEDPDTANPFAFSCLGGCNEVGDLGGGIRIDMGPLAHGASTSFQFFYGINQIGQSTDALIAQTQGLGAQYIIAGQDSGDHINSAVLGFAAAVPEPTTWAMMLTGFFGLGSVLRRRRAATGAFAA
jgi:hypothetical protein